MKKVTVHTKETLNMPLYPVKPTIPAPSVIKPTPITPQAPSLPVEPSGITNALNPHLPMVSLGGKASATISVQPLKHSQPHRHMHVKPAVKANQTNSQIESFAAKWAEQAGLSLSDFCHPSQTSQEDVLLVGRIVSDNDEKMTESSVLLEASRSGGGGARIPLDLSCCPSYALFPGQLVVLSGRNPDGSRIIVSEIKSTGSHLSALPVGEDKLGKDPLSIIVASGPYSLDTGSLDFVPLDRLLLLALETQPDLLVLIGPFIDADNSAVKLGKLPDLPESFFRSQVMAKLAVFTQRATNTRIAILPSLQELSHDFSLPQCALQPSLLGEHSEKVIALANPGILFVNELSIALSSTDVLLKLGLTEVNRSPAIADRFTRLSAHLISQGSFYPVIPPQEGVNIDWNSAEGLEIPFKPNLLICPSALRHFARPIPGEDIILLNPGQFCRKQGLGSAALISIQPAAGNTEFTSRCRIDIVHF